MDTTDQQPKPRRTLLHVKVPIDLLTALDDAAKRDFTSRSELLRRAALEFLRRERGERDDETPK